MSRRKAREVALRILYQKDVGNTDPRRSLPEAVDELKLSEEGAEFARRVVFGLLENLDAIDDVLRRHAREWSPERMANIDRNILRMALYEILFIEDIPPSVSINEAIELAKKYSTEESGRFINGVLGNVVRELCETQGD